MSAPPDAMQTERNETGPPRSPSPEGRPRRAVRPVQPPTLRFTAEGHSVPHGGVIRGYAAFHVAGEPSFASVDHALLKTPGCLTMGRRNTAKMFRPCLWCSVDNPSHIMDSAWL